MVAPTTLPTVWCILVLPLRFPAPGSSPGLPASGVRADISGQPRGEESTAGRGRGHPEHTGCDQIVTSRWPWVQFGGLLAPESTDDEDGRMRRLVSVLVPLGSLLAAACSSAGPASSSGAEPPRPTTSATQTVPTTSAAASFTPWTTYHRTAGRAGHTRTAVGTPLHRAWAKNLG